MFKKRFDRLLLKNTSAIVVPALAVFLVLIFMFMKYPVFDQAKCHNINDAENVYERIMAMYEIDVNIVEYTAKDLYYTGFDYYEDNKQKGSYYYNFNGEYMMFFLIEAENPENYLEEYTIKGKIIKDNVSISHILDKLTAETGMNENLVADSYFKYIISEPDYPYAFIALVYLLFLSPVIVCVLILIYAFLVWVCPSLHSQTRQLEKYGNVSEVIRELNYELRNNLVYAKENIYITDNYMIVSYLTKTDVIKLDMIKYLSKNLVDKSELPFGKKEVFRLTMSNPEKLFYEVDFTSEEFIDDVVRYVRGIS